MWIYDSLDKEALKQMKLKIWIKNVLNDKKEYCTGPWIDLNLIIEKNNFFIKEKELINLDYKGLINLLLKDYKGDWKNLDLSQKINKYINNTIWLGSVNLDDVDFWNLTNDSKDEYDSDKMNKPLEEYIISILRWEKKNPHLPLNEEDYTETIFKEIIKANKRKETKNFYIIPDNVFIHFAKASDFVDKVSVYNEILLDLNKRLKDCKEDEWDKKYLEEKIDKEFTKKRNFLFKDIQNLFSTYSQSRISSMWKEHESFWMPKKYGETLSSLFTNEEFFETCINTIRFWNYSKYGVSNLKEGDAIYLYSLIKHDKCIEKKYFTFVRDNLDWEDKEAFIKNENFKEFIWLSDFEHIMLKKTIISGTSLFDFYLKYENEFHYIFPNKFLSNPTTESDNLLQKSIYSWKENIEKLAKMLTIVSDYYCSYFNKPYTQWIISCDVFDFIGNIDWGDFLKLLLVLNDSNKITEDLIIYFLNNRITSFDIDFFEKILNKNLYQKLLKVNLVWKMKFFVRFASMLESFSWNQEEFIKSIPDFEDVKKIFIETKLWYAENYKKSLMNLKNEFINAWLLKKENPLYPITFKFDRYYCNIEKLKFFTKLYKGEPRFQEISFHRLQNDLKDYIKQNWKDDSVNKEFEIYDYENRFWRVKFPWLKWMWNICYELEDYFNGEQEIESIYIE